MARAVSEARPWNPNFKYSDRERWICIYPAYINSKKTLKEGRRIPKDKAVDNPSYSEIRDICANAGIILGVENKVYPRELDPKDHKVMGRIRVQLKNDDGTAMLEQFPTKNSILIYAASMIPKLKSRQQSQSSSQSGQSQGGKGQKKKGKKGR